jgi:hypothetical protein
LSSTDTRDREFDDTVNLVGNGEALLLRGSSVFREGAIHNRAGGLVPGNS